MSEPNASGPTSRLTERLKAFRKTKLYDLLAAVPLIVWYAFCAERMLPTLTSEISLVRLFVLTDISVLPVSLALSTVSHATTLAFFAVLVVLFIVRQIPQRTAPGFFPRFIAVAGTFLGIGLLLLPPQELSFPLYLTSLVLIVGGTGFAVYAALVLGRSISIVPEARRLVTSGPYAVIRHPLYLAEFFALLGVAMQYLLPWALLLLALQSAFQFLRMKNEEQVLVQTFPEYKDYMRRTARLVPGVY